MEITTNTFEQSFLEGSHGVSGAVRPTNKHFSGSIRTVHPTEQRLWLVHQVHVQILVEHQSLHLRSVAVVTLIQQTAALLFSDLLSFDMAEL